MKDNRGKAAGLIGIAAIIATGYVSNANADVPVIDPTALTQWAVSIGNELKTYALQLEQYATQTKQYVGEQLSWVKQAQQYSTQLEQYAMETRQFLNFYHNPSLGAAMGTIGSVGLGSAMPISPYAVLGLVNGLSYRQPGFPGIAGIASALSGFTSTSYATAHQYTPTDASWASQQVVARANGIAGEQGAAESAYADLQSHQTALQPLRDNLLASKDTKGVLDATAQTNLEIAWNVNALAKQQAISSAYEAQRDSLVQRDNEHLSQDIETFLATSPAP